MAKSPSYVVGVDIGRYSLKSVLLHKRGNDRYSLSHFGIRTIGHTLDDPRELGAELKALFKEMGGGVRSCAVAVSSADAIIRIIQQPQTPPQILRDALRLNGVALLNQDCKEFVLDCDNIPGPPVRPDEGSAPQHHYLVCGLPRPQIRYLQEAVEYGGMPLASIQLAPVCAYNAFEFAQREVFDTEAYMVVDVGHASSTMMIGMQKTLVLVRTVDFGANTLVETLTALTGEQRDAAVEALEQEDELMMENARMALAGLTREISSSIGFFEGRYDQTVRRVYVSGGLSKSKTALKIAGEEMGLPVWAWTPLEKCEVTVSAAKRELLEKGGQDLSVAIGAALGVFAAS